MAQRYRKIEIGNDIRYIPIVKRRKHKRGFNKKFKPIKKRCTMCGNKVFYHHTVCQKCWYKREGYYGTIKFEETEIEKI